MCTKGQSVTSVSLASTYVIVMMLCDVMETQCADRALHELINVILNISGVVGTDNSLSGVNFRTFCFYEKFVCKNTSGPLFCILYLKKKNFVLRSHFGCVEPFVLIYII
jgi:hypothetical protein